MSAQIGCCLNSWTAVKVERLRSGRSRSPRAAELVEARKSSVDLDDTGFRSGLPDEGPWASGGSRQVQMPGRTGRTLTPFDACQPSTSALLTLFVLCPEAFEAVGEFLWSSWWCATHPPKGRRRTLDVGGGLRLSSTEEGSSSDAVRLVFGRIREWPTNWASVQDSGSRYLYCRIREWPTNWATAHGVIRPRGVVARECDLANVHRLARQARSLLEGLLELWKAMYPKRDRAWQLELWTRPYSLPREIWDYGYRRLGASGPGPSHDYSSLWALPIEPETVYTTIPPENIWHPPMRRVYPAARKVC